METLWQKHRLSSFGVDPSEVEEHPEHEDGDEDFPEDDVEEEDEDNYHEDDDGDDDDSL